RRVCLVLGAQVNGAPALGQVASQDGSVQDTYSCDVAQVMDWLWDGYRSRFNDRRALRSKPVYQPNPDFNSSAKASGSNPRNIPLQDEDGKVVLTHIGKEPGVDRLKSQFRKDFSHAAAIPDLMLQHADRDENRDWFA